MNPIISTRHFQKLIESIIELSFFIIIEHFPALGFSVWVNECLWGSKEVYDVAPCLLTSLSHSPRHPFTTPWQATHPSSASLCTWGPLVPLRGAGAWGPSALAVLMAQQSFGILKHQMDSLLRLGPINLQHPMWQMSRNVAREVKQAGQTAVKQGDPRFIRPY